jgi:hypothetical protein
MYILSTIIFVIHNVFYEAKNGQANRSKGQKARHFYDCAGFPGRKQSD